MLVILKENVDHLGTIGDVVKVKDGYARNFLLPRGLVVRANEGRVRELEHYKRVLEKRRLAQKANSEELAKKLSEHSCTIKRKVGKGDKLFGSVSTVDISKELNQSGFEIKKSAIQLSDPIKTLGVHEVAVKLQTDVTAKVKVWVVKEEESD